MHVAVVRAVQAVLLIAVANDWFAVGVCWQRAKLLAYSSIAANSSVQARLWQFGVVWGVCVCAAVWLCSVCDCVSVCCCLLLVGPGALRCINARHPAAAATSRLPFSISH